MWYRYRRLLFAFAAITLTLAFAGPAYSFCFSGCTSNTIPLQVPGTNKICNVPSTSVSGTLTSLCVSGSGSIAITASGLSCAAFDDDGNFIAFQTYDLTAYFNSLTCATTSGTTTYTGDCPTISTDISFQQTAGTLTCGGGTTLCNYLDVEPEDLGLNANRTETFCENQYPADGLPVNRQMEYSESADNELPADWRACLIDVNSGEECQTNGRHGKVLTAEGTTTPFVGATVECNNGNPINLVTSGNSGVLNCTVFGASDYDVSLLNNVTINGVLPPSSINIKKDNNDEYPDWVGTWNSRQVVELLISNLTADGELPIPIKGLLDETLTLGFYLAPTTGGDGS
jgi:hypothetical protein